MGSSFGFPLKDNPPQILPRELPLTRLPDAKRAMERAGRISLERLRSVMDYFSIGGLEFRQRGFESLDVGALCSVIRQALFLVQSIDAILKLRDRSLNEAGRRELALLGGAGLSLLKLVTAE